MKRKKLTAAGIERYQPAKGRREIGDAAAPGLYLILQPSGHKSWAMRFRRPHTGKPAKLTLGPYRSGEISDVEPEIGFSLTLTEARYLAGKINRKRDAGVDVVVEAKRKAPVNSESFGQAVMDFTKNHRVRKTGERPRSFRQIAKVLGLHYPLKGGEPTIVKGGLCERWYDRPVGEIDGHDVHAVISEATQGCVPGLTARNAEASDNRGRRMADALGSLFKWAMRHRRSAMKTNPMMGTYRPNMPPARDRVLSSDEIKALWRACDDGKVEHMVIKLLLLTGSRLNEIARLEWAELADDLLMLTLPGRRTKNSISHTVPLAPLARDLIASVKRVDGCPYVFTLTGKGHVNSWSKVKRQLDETMQTAPWRLHDLRRTAATGMAEIGVAPHIVEAALNHVSGAKAGVAGIYNRALYAEEKKAALERWAAHVAGIVEGRAANVVPLAKRR